MTSFPMSPDCEGNPASPICVIGEAPAGTEMRLGRPLANQMGAGGVWNWCLAAAFGWRKGEVMARREQELYTLNLWPWPVKKDKATPPNIYAPDGQMLCKRSQQLTEAGFEAARPCLEKLSQFQGKVIMPLGAPAFNTITGMTGISKWRGSPLSVDKYGEVRLFTFPKNADWIIPSLHPAHALDREGGMYMNRYYILSDLKKAQRFVNGATIPEKTLHIAPTFKQAKEFLGECASTHVYRRGELQPAIVNTDVEVSATRRCITCFSVAFNTSEAMSIPLLDQRFQNYWSDTEERVLLACLSDILADPNITKANQNLLFDLWIYFQEWGLLPAGPMADPMCAFGILNTGLRKDLGTITSMMTDLPYYKDDGKAWVEGNKSVMSDLEQFWRYNAMDSITALEAWLGNDWHEGLAAQLQNEGFQRTYDMTVRPFPVLLEMMARGVKIDLAQLDLVQRVYEQDMREKQAELNDLVGQELKPMSPKWKGYFYEELGLAPYVNKDGKPSVDKKALMRLARKPESMAAARLLMDIRQSGKLKGTYFDIDLDPDGRARSSWNPRGTGFGRLSSSATIYGTGFNAQNLPPAMRSFLVAG